MREGEKREREVGKWTERDNTSVRGVAKPVKRECYLESWRCGKVKDAGQCRRVLFSPPLCTLAHWIIFNKLRGCSEVHPHWRVYLQRPVGQRRHRAGYPISLNTAVWNVWDSEKHIWWFLFLASWDVCLWVGVGDVIAGRKRNLTHLCDEEKKMW